MFTKPWGLDKSTWAWVPAKILLPSTTLLPINPSQATARRVSVLGSAHLKEHWRVMLPAYHHSFCMTVPHVWFLTQQGTQTPTSAWAMPLGEDFWRAVPHLLVCTFAWNSQLWYSLFWLWGTSFCTFSSLGCDPWLSVQHASNKLSSNLLPALLRLTSPAFQSWRIISMSEYELLKNKYISY